jgi:excisionase family DNA binding protein
MAIQNLTTHVSRFVTVSELAAYWLVSPQQIRRQIESGALEALRLGPRLYRIPVAAALKFERYLMLLSRQSNGSGATELPITIRRKRPRQP